MSLAASLQALTGAFQDDGVSASLQALTGSFVSDQGAIGGVAAELSALTGSFSGLGNYDGSIDASLPALTGFFNDPDSLAASLEPLSADFAALNGGIGSISAQLEPLSSQLQSIAALDAVLDGALRPLASSFTGQPLADGAMAGTLRALQGEFAGVVGTVGALAGVLDSMTASFTGHTINSGGISASFAPMFMEAVGEAAVEASFRGWAMNTRLGAVTEYTSFPYNSLARYNGTYLAASAAGLVRLAGEDDQGVDIDWAVRTGAMDDGKPVLKRCTEVVLGLRADGPVNVTVEKDGDESHTYGLVVFKEDLLHQARVKVGRGLRSRYYKVGLSGSGPSMELDSMQVTMPETTRRLG